MGKFDFMFSSEEKLKKQKEKKILEESDVLEFQKTQKRIRERIKTKEEIDKLKDLVASWIITKERADSILSWENLNTLEIKEIIEKIDELSTVDFEKKILPRGFKITKEEYLEAITNFEKKKILLGKIDDALNYIYKNMWWGWLTFSLFSFLSYNLILSKETQKVQWNLIDIKNDIINNSTL